MLVGGSGLLESKAQTSLDSVWALLYYCAEFLSSKKYVLITF